MSEVENSAAEHGISGGDSSATKQKDKFSSIFLIPNHVSDACDKPDQFKSSQFMERNYFCNT